MPNSNIVLHDELIAECVRNGKNTANFVIANFDVFTTSSFMLQKGMFLNQSIFYHECYKNRKVANHDYVLKYQFKSRLLIHFFVIALQQNFHLSVKSIIILYPICKIVRYVVAKCPCLNNLCNRNCQK